MGEEARRRRYRRRHRRHRLVVPLIASLPRLSAYLPLWLTHTLGGLLGRLLGGFPNTLRDTARDNLARCLPTLPYAERNRLLRTTLAETSKLVLELGAIWYWPRERLLPLVDDSQAHELLDELAAAGRGFIVMAPHSGCWELLGLYLSARYSPFTALYRPSRMPLDDWLMAHRQRFGGNLVGTDAAGIRQLLRTLQQGGGVGILPDQDPGPGGGRFVPFFGQAAQTMVLLSRLALRSGAPVVVCQMERLPRGAGYRLHARRASAINTPPLEASLQAMNEAVEQVALDWPGQYLWVYRRFRTVPRQE